MSKQLEIMHWFLHRFWSPGPVDGPNTFTRNGKALVLWHKEMLLDWMTAVGARVTVDPSTALELELCTALELLLIQALWLSSSRGEVRFHLQALHLSLHCGSQRCV